MQQFFKDVNLIREFLFEEKSWRKIFQNNLRMIFSQSKLCHVKAAATV